MATTINIVLVEPQIPANTGNVARTCAVTGARLHLVGPLGFELDEKRLKRAGLDYWDKLDVTHYDGLEDFFQRTEGPYYYFTSKGQHRHTDVKYPEGCYLLFGREDAGLPESLLVQHPESCLRMPMRQGVRCLNLSNTVAIAVYECLRQSNFEHLEDQGQLTQYDWK